MLQQLRSLIRRQRPITRTESATAQVVTLIDGRNPLAVHQYEFTIEPGESPTIADLLRAIDESVLSDDGDKYLAAGGDSC